MDYTQCQDAFISVTHQFNKYFVKQSFHINDLIESDPQLIHKLNQIRLAVQLGQKK